MASRSDQPVTKSSKTKQQDARSNVLLFTLFFLMFCLSRNLRILIWWRRLRMGCHGSDGRGTRAARR